MKSFLCCAFLTLPTAHGAPRHPSANSPVPLKARVVAVHPKKMRVLVSTSGASTVNNDQATEATKNTVPKVVAVRPLPSNGWRWYPKFQKTGKEEITYGFILNRPF